MARSGLKAVGMNAVAAGQDRTSKGLTPNVPGLTGKGGSKDMPPKKFSKFDGGNMYKKPKTGMSLGSHKDMSSDETGPRRAGDDNKKRYSGEKQPLQYSNAVGPQCTKFVT
jgi:hypothetical protein